jgi:hypothetical protein
MTRAAAKALTPEQAAVVVEPFLQRYRTALLAADGDGLVACFGHPGLVVTDEAVLAVSTEEETRTAYTRVAEHYLRQGMVDARPQIEKLESNSRLVITADVAWTYLGPEARVLATELVRYVLRLQIDGPRIHTVIARTE